MLYVGAARAHLSDLLYKEKGKGKGKDKGKDREDLHH